MAPVSEYVADAPAITYTAVDPVNEYVTLGFAYKQTQ